MIVAFGLGCVWLQESRIVALGLGGCGSNGMGKLIAVDLGGTKGRHKGSECVMALLQGATMMSQTLLDFSSFPVGDTAYSFFNSRFSNSSLPNITQVPSEIPNSTPGYVSHHGHFTSPKLHAQCPTKLGYFALFRGRTAQPSAGRGPVV